VLDKLGYSVQKPLPRAAEQDRKLVKAWLEKDWSRIKKSRRLGAIIVFFDEFGFSFWNQSQRLGHGKANGPSCGGQPEDRRVCVYCSSLGNVGKIYKRHFEDPSRVTSDHITPAFATPSERPGSFLIWDRARTHKSKKMQAYLAAHTEISVEELPPMLPNSILKNSAMQCQASSQECPTGR